MSKRLLIQLLFSVLFILPGWQVLHAQARVKTVIDKSRILIGEPLELTVEVRVPADEPLRFVELDTINHFELLSPPEFDTITERNTTIIRGMYRITSFDSGRWVIPPLAVSGSQPADSMAVDVVFSDADPAAPYHDIKDVLDATVRKQGNNWWWYAAGGFLLLLLLLIFLMRKKKPKPVVSAVPVPAIPAYDAAMKALAALEQSPGTTKQYYTELTAIFRIYIHRKKNILSLQKTTDDLVLQLKSIPVEPDLFSRMAGALRLGDMVKFARFEPEAAENREALKTIKESIEAIERIN